MGFYDALQLDPAVLKPRIRAVATVQERRKFQLALVLRSVLIVAFAIGFIAPLSTLFGQENSPMAMALFCILLGIRFVDMGCCIKDSLINLATSFFLLLLGPVLASLVNPFLALPIHFISFFLILLMTCDRPEMGNGGLYGFAYVFLSGNPVTGEQFWKRFGLTVVGYLLCGSILYFKHRHKNTQVRFSQIVRSFDLTSDKSRWQLRFALGVSLILTLGSALSLERFMWAGFACGSMLSGYPYTVDVRERFWHRMLGVVLGSSMFYVMYLVLPPSLHSLLGPIGGLCLGFCTDYRYKTAINCFGALMMATALYGVQGAVLLRILNNLLGVTFGFTVILLYQKVMERWFDPAPENVKE